MSFLQLLVLLTIGALFWYWLDSMRIQERAHKIGKKGCENAGVMFLDDTVVLTKIGLRRDDSGYMRLFREYHFEFTSDGSRRYEGIISMNGRQLQQFHLEPFRIPSPGDDV
jgi:hypothetical protein